MQIAQALKVVHEAGIIHRDLKPSNLMILGGTKIKVLDFGLARWQSKPETREPDDYVSGTPGYVPPEVIQGGAFDYRMDVYALGIIAYELLSGASPYPGQVDDSLWERILGGQVAFPISSVSGVTPEMASIVSRMIHVTPEERLPSMDAVIQEIQSLIPR